MTKRLNLRIKISVNTINSYLVFYPLLQDSAFQFSLVWQTFSRSIFHQYVVHSQLQWNMQAAPRITKFRNFWATEYRLVAYVRAIQRLSMASGTNEHFPIDTETLKDVVWGDASVPQKGRKGESLTEVNKPHTTALGIYVRTYTQKPEKHLTLPSTKYFSSHCEIEYIIVLFLSLSHTDI